MNERITNNMPPWFRPVSFIQNRLQTGAFIDGQLATGKNNLLGIGSVLVRFISCLSSLGGAVFRFSGFLSSLDGAFPLAACSR